MFDDWHLKRPLLDVLDLQTLVDVEITYAGAAQSDQVGSALQRLTDVSCQSADVSTLATDDADSEIGNLLDAQVLRLGRLWCWSLSLNDRFFLVQIALLSERYKTQILDTLLPAAIFLDIYAIADGRKKLFGLRRDDTLLREMQVEKLNLVDDQFLGLELYLLTLTYIVKSASTLYLTGRIDRRNLPDASLELLKRLHHRLSGNVAGREGCIDRMLRVKRRCRTTQAQCSDVLFGTCLQLVDLLRGLAGADDHHTTGQRIEGTGMANLEFLDTQTAAQIVTDHFHQIERSPGKRFVEGDYLTFYKIVWFQAYANYKLLACANYKLQITNYLLEEEQSEEAGQCTVDGEID